VYFPIIFGGTNAKVVILLVDKIYFLPKKIKLKVIKKIKKKVEGGKDVFGGGPCHPLTLVVLGVAFATFNL